MNFIIELPNQKDFQKAKEIEKKLKSSDIDGLVIKTRQDEPGVGEMGIGAIMPSVIATIKAAQEPLTKLVEVLGSVATLWKTELKLSRSTEQGEKEEIGIITSRLGKDEILQIVEKFYASKDK